MWRTKTFEQQAEEEGRQDAFSNPNGWREQSEARMEAADIKSKIDIEKRQTRGSPHTRKCRESKEHLNGAPSTQVIKKNHFKGNIFISLGFIAAAAITTSRSGESERTVSSAPSLYSRRLPISGLRFAKSRTDRRNFPSSSTAREKDYHNQFL